MRCRLSAPVDGTARALRRAGAALATALASAVLVLPAAAQAQAPGALPPVVLPGPAEPETFTLTRISITGARTVPVADLQAESNATSRAAKEVASDIHTRLAAYMASHGT